MAGGWERAWHAAGETSRRLGRGVAGASRATVRAGRAAANGTRRAGVAAADGTRAVGRATRRLTHAGGAGRTGLGRLIELTAVHAAGDALIAVALTDTFLFGLPVNEARGQVALYLLITMAPFAVLAPFVGPVLDRFRSGRRYVMAGTLFARGLLCWAMAAAVVAQDAVTLFPAALAVLVLSKAYNVSRAAIMPSVLPADFSLVTANARVALFTLVSAGLTVPVAAGLTAWLGGEWVLRGTVVLFLVAGVSAVRLPRHVDSPDPEPDPATGPAAEPDGEPGPTGMARRARHWRTLLDVGPAVSEAMRANAAIRLFSGYLLFFLLFLVQEGRLPGLATPVTLALLVAAAGAGGLAGAAVASWVRSHSPQVTILLTLAAATVCGLVAAVWFTLWTALVVALTAAFAQELGKLALDAIVQREIGEEVRSSTFGVVEALLQIAWVAGGLIGLGVSLLPAAPAGMAIIAVCCAAALGWLLVARRARMRARDERIRRARRRAGVAPPDSSGRTKPLTHPHG